MELSIKDRLYLPTFLPERGTFSQFNLKKSILRKIAITEEEREAIQLHENTDNKRIEWDTKKESPLHTDFTAEELTYLRDACEKLSEEELPDEAWGIIERLYEEAQSEK